jgi:aspartate aminotransferase
MIYQSSNLNLGSLEKSATLTINERMQEMVRAGQHIYRLGFGQSPFPVPAHVVAALQEHAHEKDYLPVKGLYQLRETVAHYWKRTQDLSYTAEDVIVSPGSKELLFLVQLAYYGELLLPSPSWVSYAPQATIIGRPVKWIDTHPENDWMLTAKDLEKVCQDDPKRPRILILNYPSNPTGATFTNSQLETLAAVARKYNILLLSDEIYGDLHHQGQHKSIAHYYPEGTIISSGLSKWCGAGGWRLGVFTFPPELRWLQEQVAVIASETYTSTSTPIQYAAITAYEDHPVIGNQLQQSQRILGALGQHLYHQLKEMNVHTPSPSGGFYLFPNFEQHKTTLAQKGVHDSRSLCEKLLQDTGVALLPSAGFGRQAVELTARLSYVDFDGEHALKIANTDYADKELDEAYLKACCPSVLEAFDRMDDWLSDL